VEVTMGKSPEKHFDLQNFKKIPMQVGMPSYADAPQ
jgi:hypothetical protein